MVTPQDDIDTESVWHDMRMDGVFFFRSRAPAPFCRHLDPGNFSYCVAVRSGRMRLHIDFPSEATLQLGAGDVIAISGLAQHAFRSAGANSHLVAAPFERAALNEYSAPAECDLVIGAVPNESLALGSLMIGPILVRPREHPNLSRRLWRTIEMLEDEYSDASLSDRNLVIRRLAEIMLVNMERRLHSGGGSHGQEGARTLATRQLMHAVDAFMAKPQHLWTLDELARKAGMCRTRFAEEFRAATGQTPVRILTRMRLTMVARRLATETMSIEAAAEEAGYSSAAAFIRAFQREFGEPPALWRRRRRELPGRAHVARSEELVSGDVR